jgi:hypothetical protein
MAGIFRGRTWGLVAGIVVFTALAAWFARREERGREEALEPDAVDAPKHASDARASGNESVLAAERDASLRAKVETDAPIQPAVAALRGLAVDVEGRPLAGLTLIGQKSKRELRTDANGEFDVSDVDGRLKPAPPWVLVRGAQEQEGERAPLLVIAPGVQVAGRVETADGTRLGGARVGVPAPLEAFPRFSRPLDRTRDEMEDVTSADDGTFAFLSPVFDEAMLHARLDGYVEHGAAAPAAADADLRIVLTPIQATVNEAAKDHVISGIVVHPDQSPASGALVRFGSRSTTAGDDGTFRIPLDSYVNEETALVAMHPGRQAAVMARYGHVVNGSERTPVRLVLGGAPLSIAGRVVGAKGEPMRDFEVALFDGTTFDSGMIPPETAEAQFGERNVRTKKDGSFALAGLLDREYRVQVWSSKEFVKVISGPVRAGRNDVEIVVPTSARIEKLEGRVVGRDGRGIANVNVRVALVTFRTRNGYSMEHSDPVRTSETGAFSIANAPALDGFLDFSGDEIVPKGVEYENTDTSRPIVVELERRCHFRIEGVPESSGAVRFEMKNASGETQHIRQFQEGGWSSSTSYSLQKGATAPLAVSESATVVVFLDAKGIEVARRNVSLVPGQVTPIRW